MKFRATLRLTEYFYFHAIVFSANRKKLELNLYIHTNMYTHTRTHMFDVLTTRVSVERVTIASPAVARWWLRLVIGRHAPIFSLAPSTAHPSEKHGSAASVTTSRTVVTRVKILRKLYHVILVNLSNRLSQLCCFLSNKEAGRLSWKIKIRPSEYRLASLFNPLEWKINKQKKS